jgi:methylenetetrahydrofolate dehydrogenase (NADP+)/methenyltetrahydrofolate cyclohydrolase
MDGKSVAQGILAQAAARVERIVKAGGPQPALATVLVGEDPASATYVRMKAKRCEAAGMRSVRVELPATIDTQTLVERVGRLGSDPSVHGILLQHPVPGHIDERSAFEAIPPAKDVDGVTIQSFGDVALAAPGRPVTFGCCTPMGIMRLLEAYNVPLEGSHAVVVGRSSILGKPMAMMLLAANATVTICHSRTTDLPRLVEQADVVVAAVGRPRFIRGEWIRPGAVVIDAGYNEGNVGDVDFDAAAAHAGLITPVPGGVGPMTIATLIDQASVCAARQLNPV